MVHSKLLSKFGNLKHFFAETDINATNLFWNHSKNILIEAEQIHGNKVSWLLNNEIRFIKDADGLGTGISGLALQIRTADCLPIFIFDKKKNFTVAVHAGWKGLYLGIIKKTIDVLKEHGGNKKDLIIAVGPHIKRCCYSVDKERIESFKSQIPERLNYYYKKKGDWFLDLDSIAVFQLMQEGVKDENIEILSDCTCCCDKYFSYRRDGKNTGRMSNIIYLTGN